MVNTIIQSFDIWTDAQGLKSKGRVKSVDNISLEGIARLRELILDLAIRGKLVSQNPNDEPASKLLEKIEIERKELVKKGIIKSQKKYSPFSDSDKLFDLPTGWEWVRVGMIGYDWGQKTPDAEFSYIEVSGIDNNKGKIQSTTVLAANKAPSRARKIVKKGTVIYSTVRPYLQNICEIDKDIEPEPIASTAFAIVHPYQNMPGRYFVNYFRSPLFINYVEEVQTGIAYPAINDKQFFNGMVPLPPLEEQKRIVAKVDELMALCDKLEEEQSQHLKTHQTLVKTLLETLTLAKDASELQAAWQRMEANFDTLFCTEDSIDQLKQTILQLAVMGKLVKQDPDDEPASELLKKIAKEKEKLVKEGKIKKEKPLKNLNKDKVPYKLPALWCWSKIGNASLFTEYGMSEKTYENIDGVPVLKMGDIKDGKVMLGGQKVVSYNVEGLPSLYLKKGDLLYNRTKSAELVGKTGLFEGSDDNYTFASYLIRIRCAKNCLRPKYMNFTMNAPLFRETQIVPHLKQQCGQANVNGTILKNMIIPFPPLSEQNRIVKKVEKLFALCDTIKEKIIKAQELKGLLAKTVVEGVVG